MYQVLVEELSKARGVTPPKFKVEYKGGVRECDSVEEILGASKNK